MLVSIHGVLTKIPLFATYDRQILRLVEAFVDPAPKCTLVQAAEIGDSRLFRRVLHWKKTRLSVNPIVLRHELERAGTILVNLGNKRVIKENNLHVEYSQDMVLAAAVGGDVELLLWVVGVRGHRENCWHSVRGARCGVPCALWDIVCCRGLSRGHLKMVRWIWQQKLYPVSDINKFFESAALTGDVDTLKWGHRLVPFDRTLIDIAARGGYLDVLKFIHSKTNAADRGASWGQRGLAWAIAARNAEVSAFFQSIGVQEPATCLAVASQYERVDLLKDWATVRVTPNDQRAVIYEALKRGHLPVLQWAINAWGLMVSCREVQTATWCGHLHLLQWIFDNHCGEWITDDYEVQSVPQAAAQAGHLAIVKWAHTNLREGWGPRVLDAAITGGHVAIVKFLHEHRNEGCHGAMDKAAEHGHLHVLRYLHQHGIGGCTTKAMDLAARNGHLDIVQWLHENRAEGCTTGAMDIAAINGHLEVVVWLHEHRQEGCTATAIEECPHACVVEWLLSHYEIDWSPRAISGAACNGNLHLLQLLFNHRPSSLSPRQFGSLARNGVLTNGRLQGIRWLYELSPQLFAEDYVQEYFRVYATEAACSWFRTVTSTPARGVIPSATCLRRP